MEKDALQNLNVDSLYESNDEYNLHVGLYHETVGKKHTNVRRFIIAEYAGRLRRYKPSNNLHKINRDHDIMAIAFTSAIRTGIAEEDSYLYVFDSENFQQIRSLKSESFHRKPFHELSKDQLKKEVQLHCFFAISNARYCFFLEEEYKKLTGESASDFQKQVALYLKEHYQETESAVDEIENEARRQVDKAVQKLVFLGKPAHMALIIDLLIDKGYIRKEGKGERTARILLNAFSFENHNPSYESLGKLLHKGHYPIKDDQAVRMFYRIPSRDQLE
jgi:hypothetical protein